MCVYKDINVFTGGDPMKTRIIKIGLIIGVLLFLCGTTSWANSRKYHHNDNTHTYRAKQSKADNYHHPRIPHYSGHDKRPYYAKQPKHSVRRHHIKHRHHHYYRPTPRYHHHYRPAPRYHHRPHYDYSYPYRHGFWFFWRSH